MKSTIYNHAYIKFIGYEDDKIIWTQIIYLIYEENKTGYENFMKKLYKLQQEKVKIHKTKVKLYFSNEAEYEKSKNGEDIRECDELKRIKFFNEP